MTKAEVLKQLENFGDERTKNTLRRHGAKEPFFGVKVGDLKKILKQTKKDQALSLALYQTGNSDAMYLAGLMADEKQVTKEQLREWVQTAYWFFLSESTVPWLAADTPHGFELGLEWIDSDQETIAAAGWSTLSNVASVKANETLDINQYEQLLDRVVQELDSAPNRVRYTMNGFVIAVGSYIPALTEKAQATAEKIGKVDVSMGDTACKVPLASAYIQKVIDQGRLGKKRKKARC